MIEIAPGDTFTYTFTADYAGGLDVPLRHGADPPPHRQWDVRDGSSSSPRAVLPEVDQEVALVQSEWYLGAQ